MIGVLGGLIDTDTIRVNRVNFERRTVEVRMELEARMRAVGNLDARASARMFEHPMIAHFERMGATGLMRLSDFTTSRELHRTRLYNDTFRPLGIEYLVSVSTPIGRGARSRWYSHGSTATLTNVSFVSYASSCRTSHRPTATPSP
jgi:hypothetical protein